jgi:hypothetical protein
MNTSQNIAQRYIEIWNETNAEARRSKIDELFTESCIYTDPLVSTANRAGLDTFIGAAQKQFAGVVFRLVGNVDAHHDVARFTWHAMAPGVAAPVAIGFDVAVLEAGRIKQIAGFLDKAPPL